MTVFYGDSVMADDEWPWDQPSQSIDARDGNGSGFHSIVQFNATDDEPSGPPCPLLADASFTFTDASQSGGAGSADLYVVVARVNPA